MRSNVVGLTRYALHSNRGLHVRPALDGTDNERVQGVFVAGIIAAQDRINRRHRAGKKRYPLMRLDPVVFRSSDPRKARTLDKAIDAEFLQLTDLLLGATAQSLEFLPSKSHLGRLRLAKPITLAIAKRAGSPAYLFDRHLRHYSVSLWPDECHRMYAAIPPRKPEPDPEGLPLAIGDPEG